MEKGANASALGYLDKYGQQAKYGVIFITTKSRNAFPANGNSGDKVFKKVDEMPRFPGCELLTGEERIVCSQKKMLEFDYNHIAYPQEAREKNIEGTVMVGFVVGVDGSISKIEVKRSLSYGTDEAVVSVVEAMNGMEEKWIPGRHEGKNVSVQFMLPVKFKLAETEVREDRQEIFKVVEEMPRFPGCETGHLSVQERKQCSDQKMLEFIYNQVTYTQNARDAGIEGVSVVQFTVNKEGFLEDAKIVRSIGCGTDELVLDIVDRMNIMPERWIPGKQRGKTVNVRFNLLIKFKLAQSGNNSERIPAPGLVGTVEKNGSTPEIFPNPASDKIHIRMNLPDRERVKADIH